MMQKQVKIAGIKVKVSLYTTQFDYCPSKLKSLLKKIVFFLRFRTSRKCFTLNVFSYFDSIHE